MIATVTPPPLPSPLELFRFISCNNNNNNDNNNNMIGFTPWNATASFLGSLLPITPDTGDFQCLPPHNNNLSTGGFSPLNVNNGARFESEHDISLLQQYITQQQRSQKSKGFTISVQFTPAPLTNNIEYPFPILTIGTTNHDDMHVVTASTSPLDLLCDNYEFLIAQFHSFLLFSYRANDVARSCRTRLYTTNDHNNNNNNNNTSSSSSSTTTTTSEDPLLLVQDKINTITVTTDTNETMVYLQGTLLSRSINHNPFDITWWDSRAHLQLFSNPSSPITFPGIIHSVSMYDTVFSAQDVQDIYQGTILDSDKSPTLSPTHSPFSSSFSPTRRPLLVLLTAPPSDNIVLQQGQVTPVTITLGSLNISSTQDQILVVDIVSWPKFGRLLSFDGNPAVSRMVIRIPDSTITMRYQLENLTYFNAPNSNARGETLPLELEWFRYRILVMDHAGMTASSSTLMTQVIHVVHVNHPPTLTVSSSLSSSSSSLVANNPHAAVKPFDMIMIVFNDGDDLNMDMVRVDVSTLYGTLSFSSFSDNNNNNNNSNSGRLSAFASCANRTGSWHCRHDPHNITFVAVPDDVPLILQQVVYHPTAELGNAEEDSIIIRVYDGQGGNCLDATEHVDSVFNDESGVTNRFQTIYSDCYEVESVIPYHITTTTTHAPILPQLRGNNHTGGDGNPEPTLQLPTARTLRVGPLIFWIIMCTIVILFVLGLRWIRNWFVRGSAIEPETCHEHSENFYHSCGREQSKQ